MHMVNLHHVLIQLRRQAGGWFGLCVLLSAVCVQLSFGAAPAPTNAPPAEIVIPKSEFTDDVKDRNARDPFFPLSTRRKIEEEINQAPKAVAPTKIATADQFTVQAIAGPKTRRLAIINKTVFETGNEFQVVSSEGITNIVKCWEIRPKSVIISIDRRPERSEIFLKTPSFNLQK
jgi:hypothetical protein